MRSSGRLAAAILAVLVPHAAAQSNAARVFADALARETSLRSELRAGRIDDRLLARIRTLVTSYDEMARLLPEAEYGDRALWQGGRLAADTFDRSRDARDLGAAVRMLEALATRFPASPLASRAHGELARLGTAEPAAKPRPVPDDVRARDAAPPLPPPASGVAALVGVDREVLPETLRIILRFDREVMFRHEQRQGRIYLELVQTQPARALSEAILVFADDVVGQIRVGRQSGDRASVMLDLRRHAAYSVYSLYHPFRLIVDVERTRPSARR